MKPMMAALILCMVSAGASAQAVTPPMPGDARTAPAMQQLEARFANANTTHDGKLTREQAMAGMPLIARHFDEIDRQQAGYVTLPEIAAFAAQRFANR